VVIVSNGPGSNCGVQRSFLATQLSSKIENDGMSSASPRPRRAMKWLFWSSGRHVECVPDGQARNGAFFTPFVTLKSFTSLYRTQTPWRRLDIFRFLHLQHGNFKISLPQAVVSAFRLMRFWILAQPWIPMTKISLMVLATCQYATVMSPPDGRAGAEALEPLVKGIEG
jgi:hypothetical protein